MGPLLASRHCLFPWNRDGRMASKDPMPIGRRSCHRYTKVDEIPSYTKVVLTPLNERCATAPRRQDPGGGDLDVPATERSGKPWGVFPRYAYVNVVVRAPRAAQMEHQGMSAADPQCAGKSLKS